MRQNGLSSRSSDNTNNVAKSNESCGTHCNETDGDSVNYTDFGALVLLSSGGVKSVFSRSFIGINSLIPCAFS